MVVLLQLVNVVAKTVCDETFSIEDLVRKYGARMDMDFQAAKFCFFRMDHMHKTREIVVNVYESGKIVCVGAVSIQHARDYTVKVLQKLGIDNYSTTDIQLAVMSGSCEVLDIYKAIPLLKNKYKVKCNTDIFPGLEITDNDIKVKLYLDSNMTKINVTGPNKQDISNTIGIIYRLIRDYRSFENP